MTDKTVTELLYSIASGVGQGADVGRAVPVSALSNWREEVHVVYYIGKGRFSSGPNFVWDKARNRFEFYINLQMTGFDLNGGLFGYQMGVHHSLSTVEDFLATPRPPEGSFTDPFSEVPRREVKEYTKGVWTFPDGSAVYAVGPAQSHLVPFNDGSFLFMVTTAQTITGGTGRFAGCAGTKQATGTAFVPPDKIQSGKFPVPDLVFDAKTIETFRILKKQDMARPPHTEGGPPPEEPGAKEEIRRRKSSD